MPEQKQRILQTALDEYARNGIEGARLQAIADEVGVTKAMIHYYFGSRENLFQEVFREACGTIMKNLLNILETDEVLFVKIDRFVNAAIERFHSEPALTDFVTTALNKYPESTVHFMRELIDYDVTVFEKQLQEAAENYEIASVNSNQVVLNMLSLCMFPYGARTFMSQLLNMDNEEEYRELLSQRKGIVTDTIINWLAT